VLDPATDPAFRFFPTDYRWSMGLLLALNASHHGGAQIDEVNRVGRVLRDKIGDDDAWVAAWSDMARRMEQRGREQEKAGHKLTAAAYLMRACNYYQAGERFQQPKSAASNETYARSVTCFRDAAGMIVRPRIEHVEVPYAGASLPALLVHPDPVVAKYKPAPAMVYLDGFDVTKEIQYFTGVPDLAARGVACLIVDGPGNGESVRLRNLPLIAETEKYASAAYAYLAGRKEIDEKRIGVMALSLGGYYAPRAASLEPRFACAIAWGAQWDYHAVWARRFEALDSGKVQSLSVPPEHLEWVLGVEGRAEAMKKLEGFRLDGIVQRMRCPFLLVHGRDDEQIPLATAQRCFDAVGSTNKMLKVFDRDEGGHHHCQVDNVTIGTHFMWDWAADVLQAGA
jgi:alpha-beta hydrolase superfamily lysophospholipase